MVLLVTKWFPQEVEKQLSSSSGKIFRLGFDFQRGKDLYRKIPITKFWQGYHPPIPSLLFLSKVKHENLSRLWNWQLAWEMMCCVSQEFCADKQISQEWKYGDMSRKFSVFLANVYSNSRCTKNFPCSRRNLRKVAASGVAGEIKKSSLGRKKNRASFKCSG